MESFLDKLAGELLKRYGSFESMAIVFPTRRAGLFFRESLSRRIDKPAWTPVLYSIQDFIREHAAATVPDLLALQVELYTVYRKYFPEMK